MRIFMNYLPCGYFDVRRFERIINRVTVDLIDEKAFVNHKIVHLRDGTL